MYHRVAVALLALLLSPTSPLRAQGEGLAPGTRVRVWPDCAPPPDSGAAPPCAPVVGQLLAIGPTSVLIQPEGRPAEALPRGASTRLEVSGGSRHHTLLGLGAGAVVGFGVGMILAARAGCDSGIFGDSENGEDEYLCGTYGIVAIPAGAALGAVVGRLISSERWRPSAASGAALRLTPSRERLTLSVALAF